MFDNIEKAFTVMLLAIGVKLDGGIHNLRL